MSLVTVAWIVVAGPAVGAIPGTGTISESVQEPRAFQAVQVDLMNTAKNILFMVYTAAGRYQAINLFPGNHEVTVVKRGLASDKKRVALKAGERLTLDFLLCEAPPEAAQPGSFGGGNAAAQLVSYDQLYPPGPGRTLLEKTCIYCDGRGFIPGRQGTAESAHAAIDLMMVADEKTIRHAMLPAGSLSAQERQLIVDYLAKNYPPGSPRRTLPLRVDAEFPLDERALSKAMYVEYYLPLDPRTGAFKHYVLPVPDADPHGLVVDSEGHVFWEETTGFHLGRLDPKRGEMTRYPMDSSGQHPGRGHTPIVDSRQDIWYTAIAGDLLGKWDRKTQKTKVWKVPIVGAALYRIQMDKEEKNVWITEFRGCKVAKFEIATEKFAEYPALAQPCLIRRLSLDHQGNVWYAVFSGGKIGKLDPKTGKIVEYAVPMSFSEPYEIQPDYEGSLWFSDGGQGGHGSALTREQKRSPTFLHRRERISPSSR